MFRAFFKSRKWAPWAYGGGLLLIVLLCIQAYYAYQSILVNSELYGMIDDRAKVTPEYYDSVIWHFIQITIMVMIIQFFKEVIQNWYSVFWREAITYYYLPLWQLYDVDLTNVNQRIQEDPFEFAGRAVGMMVIGLDAMIKLIVFIPMLWALGNIATWSSQFAGSLFWLLLAICIGGTVISGLSGWGLKKFQYDKRDVEASFQAKLVMAEKCDKLLHTRPEKINPLFSDVKKLHLKLFLYMAFFNFWKSSYHQSVVIIPFLIAKVDVISGLIGWRILKKMNDTIDQVKIHLSFFVDHWQELMELLAVFKRLHELETQLKEKQAEELAN